MRSRATALAVVVSLLAACSGAAVSSSGNASAPPAPGSGRPAQPSAAVELTVYGAASLRGALEQAKAAYETANPGTTLTLSTDSSSALATQIEQGAPADLFLSADTTNPRKLVDAGLVEGAPVTFASNALTVIVRADGAAEITSPADLAKPGVRIIAAGDEVPITRYATQLVDNLAREAGYPAHFAAAYTANIVSKEDNVKAVVTKIELGEGDAGIVYVTDAKALTTVATIDVPSTSDVAARYDGVVIRDSMNAAAAKAFLTWLAGPDGRAILGALGFLAPT